MASHLEQQNVDDRLLAGPAGGAAAHREAHLLTLCRQLTHDVRKGGVLLQHRALELRLHLHLDRMQRIALRVVEDVRAPSRLHHALVGVVGEDAALELVDGVPLGSFDVDVLEASGYAYYINNETGETTWEKPIEFMGASSTVSSLKVDPASSTLATPGDVEESSEDDDGGGGEQDDDHPTNKRREEEEKEEDEQQQEGSDFSRP